MTPNLATRYDRLTNSPVWDWRSTLCNWRFCQVQNRDTKTRKNI